MALAANWEKTITAVPFWQEVNFSTTEYAPRCMKIKLCKGRGV